MSDDIFNKLKAFVVDNYMVEEDEVDWDASLVDQGVIDSIGLIEIVSFLETNYGITIEESDITREHFGSARKMARFAQSRIS